MSSLVGDRPLSIRRLPTSQLVSHSSGNRLIFSRSSENGYQGVRTNRTSTCTCGGRIFAGDRKEERVCEAFRPAETERREPRRRVEPEAGRGAARAERAEREEAAVAAEGERRAEEALCWLHKPMRAAPTSSMRDSGLVA